ncbi:3beta-hydroxysteroid-dehydrogenase/ decarboxylaseisoform 2 [Striga asiatica]|uniref:3beta-hydroxysteroid-dehydrogenase/ decarboxylaseisoform 2 n=1 Tax=Striga asiatica TaxID=4170 RepID=A0A5A7QZH5_STRAF|nr:3beta-hydroxysteroid-dehydrogenase/ decarboxylaseisoform 2 [Striga asiatica]
MNPRLTHGHESLFYVSGILGTSLHERNADFISESLYQSGEENKDKLEFWISFSETKLIRGQTGKNVYLSCLIRDSSVFGKVTLVSYQKFVYILTGIPIDFVQPLLHIVEALHVSYIIYYLPHNSKLYSRFRITKAKSELEGIKINMKKN